MIIIILNNLKGQTHPEIFNERGSMYFASTLRLKEFNQIAGQVAHTSIVDVDQGQQKMPAYDPFMTDIRNLIQSEPLSRTARGSTTEHPNRIQTPPGLFLWLSVLFISLLHPSVNLQKPAVMAPRPTCRRTASAPFSPLTWHAQSSTCSTTNPNQPRTLRPLVISRWLPISRFSERPRSLSLFDAEVIVA